MAQRRSRYARPRTLLHRRDEPGAPRALTRLVLSGGVISSAFAMGLLFGDHASVEGESVLDGGLAQIDELSERYDEVRSELTLTFHDELTSAERAVAASRKRRGEVAEGVRDRLPILSKVDDPLAEPAPPAQAAAQPAAKPAPEPSSAPRVQPEQPEQPVRSVPKKTPVDVDTDSSAAAVKSNRRRLASALSNLLGDEAPAWTKDAAPKPERKPAVKSAEPTPAPAQPHFLQVASSPDRAASDKLKAQLAARGHPAEVREVNLGGRQMFRVVVTGFQSRDEADAARTRVASAFGMKGLVRKGR